MSFDLRIEQLEEKHIEPYVLLSRAEFGNSPAVSQASHLRWKFIENPQGPSVGIHLYQDSELVARMVALSKQIRYSGKVYRAAHIVDFLVHPRHRGMNSLFQLVKGLKQLSGFDLQLIMAPNAAGAAVWEKFVKMPGPFNLDVAVAPIRPAGLLQSTGKLRSGFLAPFLDWPWRQFLRGTLGIAASLNHTQIDSRWPEKAELQQMLSADWGERAVGLRTPEFLDWRYRRSPIFQYRVSFLRHKNELVGYFVTRRTVYDGMDCLFVVDAFGRPDATPAAWRAASYAEVSRASTEGAELAMILGNTTWGPLSVVKGIPFLHVPPRVLPRKTTVYAQWITQPGFDIRQDNFYVVLGDSDVI